MSLKVIGNFNKVYYMMGIVDRVINDARVYCVLDNLKKECLLPIIAKNLYTIDDIKIKHNQSH